MPHKNITSRREQRPAARDDTRTRTTRLIERLESEIAATADQRAVLSKAFEHPLVVEPHRDHHAYHLGSDLFYCGLATGDGTAMMGLMSVGPERLAQLLLEAARIRPHIYVARLWPMLIDANRDEYEARGRYVAWQRRWARYKEEADSWGRYQEGVADGTWRERHPTPGQRQLVRDCAILLDIDPPEALNRGAVHDWLMINGANAVYRKEV